MSDNPFSIIISNPIKDVLESQLLELYSIATNIILSYPSNYDDIFINKIILKHKFKNVFCIKYEYTNIIEYNPLNIKNKEIIFWNNISRISGISAIPNIYLE
jgi:hypothetical protein